MGTTKLDLGYGNSHIKGVDYISIPQYGRGAVGAYPIAGYPFMYWKIKAPYSTTFNELLVLSNSGFFPYSVGSPAYSGLYNTGVKLGYSIGLAYGVPNLNVVPNIVGSPLVIPSTATIPLTMSFSAANIPQPTNPLWDGNIYVILILPSSNVITFGNPQNTAVYQTVAYNYRQNV
jgi:hypothetical protein